jgi:hypothetical protein
MKIGAGRFTVFGLCTLAIAVQFSGCTVGAKSFSMDSVSRMPFFGLELWERKPKSSGPAFREIRRSGSDMPYIGTALNSATSTKKKWNTKIALNDGSESTQAAFSAHPSSSEGASGNRSSVFPVNDRNGTKSSQLDSTGTVDFN